MLLLKVQSQRTLGLTWLLPIIEFVILILQCDLARSGNVTATVKSPGVMSPSELSILIGGNASIQCQLVEPNSTSIWFYDKNNNRNITQPSQEIQVVDNFTAILNIWNAPEQITEYRCMVGKNAIGITKLYVGNSPQNVADFSCIVYDYSSMICSFTTPRNMILTSFDLKYRFGDGSSYYTSDLIEPQETYQKLYYNVSGYLPARDEYIFTLNGTNNFGTNIQKFTIHNHKIVKPSPAQITVNTVNSDSVNLTLTHNQISYYNQFGDGLFYKIQLRDSHSVQHIPPRMGIMKSQTDNVVIDNLYAFWQYEVILMVKSTAVDQNDESLWSAESTISFITKSRRPRKAPHVPSGSYYIDSTDTQLRLYWQDLPESEHNGYNFHYQVEELGNNGVVINSTSANVSTLSLSWKTEESKRLFRIRSANINGSSSEASLLSVYRNEDHRYELNDENIAKVYHNSSYTLSWSRPENLESLENYTVFWCLPKIELANQCKGPISFKYLNKYETTFTTEPKDRSLNLAISANYRNYTKGMQWARCSVDASSELMKTEVDVKATNASSILVKWSSGACSLMQVKGYNLTYCIASESNKCVEPAKTLLLRKESRNHTISKLPPYSKICLSMFMFSSNKQGRDSDLTCVKTLQSAPSPPKHLEVISRSVTSTFAKIKWSPPDIHNGILKYYTVYWGKIHEPLSKSETISINQTSFILTGLSGSTDYHVYVTAHTIAESRSSNIVTISTPVGVPPSPQNTYINESERVIYWDQPTGRSGRHVFYVVALLHRYGNNDTVYERVSIVRGNSCRFQIPDCSNQMHSYSLKVRAVNVAARDEVDHALNSKKQVNITEGADIDQSFCRTDNRNGLHERFDDIKDKLYFTSPWMKGERDYMCPPDSTASIYAVAFVIVISFAVYLCYWIRNKYYKMKNIKVILPEGLVDQVSNYKFAGNALTNGCGIESASKKQLHSDISRSNDCLVGFGHIENQNIISDFRNGSTNPLTSLSPSNSSKEHPNDETGEHPSLETTNEELSSNSNSSSNSNLAYHSHAHVGRSSSVDNSNDALDVLKYERNEDDENNIDTAKEYNCEEDIGSNINIGDGGYVTHNSQLLASILNASERTVPTSFPAMTNDGYIQPSVAKQLFQPQPPPPTSLNGYTCIESLNKLSTIPDDTIQNVTSPTITSPMSAHVRPLPNSLEESDSHNKDILTPTTSPTTNQQPNNNNCIYGYVTQQQLANFGTNVALAK